MNCNNCFGYFSRDSGHRRVPEPPDNTTGWINMVCLFPVCLQTWIPHWINPAPLEDQHFTPEAILLVHLIAYASSIMLENCHGTGNEPSTPGPLCRPVHTIATLPTDVAAL